jgi:hypothetical protein
MRRAALAVPFLVLLSLSCKGSDERVIGTWQAGTQSVEFRADKTFSTGTGPQAIAGTWSFDGKKVSASIATIGGKSVSDLMDQVDKVQSAMPGSAGQAEKFKDALTKPLEFELSEDGKALKTQNPLSGQQATFTRATGG